MPTTQTTARLRRRRGARRHLGAGLAAGALLLTAACSGSDDPDDAAEGGGGGGAPEESGGDGLDVGELDTSVAPDGYEPSPEFLRQVVDRSEASTYRFEMTMNLRIDASGESIDNSVDLMTGDWDGAEYRQHVDIAANMEEAAAAGEDVPEELTSEDAYVEVVGNTDAMYIQAPFADDAAGALADMGASSPLYDIYAGLGDSWGYVDLARAGAGSGAAAGALGNSAFDPRSLVTTLREAGEVTELGTADIDDIPVTGVAGTTTLGAMLEDQGMDPDTFVQQVGVAAEVPDEDLDAFNQLPLPIEVWMTQGGLVRQVRMVQDTEFMAALVDAVGQDTAVFEDEVEEFVQTVTVDYLDYGADDITVELPDQSQTIDITDDFTAALTS